MISRKTKSINQIISIADKLGDYPANILWQRINWGDQRHGIYAGVEQCFLLTPTHSVLYIKELPKDTPIKLVNIYADDNTVYGHNPQKIGDQRLAADLSFYHALKSQREETEL